MKKQIIIVRSEQTTGGWSYVPQLYTMEMDEDSDKTVTEQLFEQRKNEEGWKNSFVRDGFNSVDGKLIVVDRDDKDYTVTEHIDWERNYTSTQKAREKFITALNNLSEDIDVAEKIINVGRLFDRYSYELCFVVNFRGVEINLLATGAMWDKNDILRNYANCAEALTNIKETWGDVEEEFEVKSDYSEYSTRLRIGHEVKEILKCVKPEAGSRIHYVTDIVNAYIDDAQKKYGGQ